MSSPADCSLWDSRLFISEKSLRFASRSMFADDSTRPNQIQRRHFEQAAQKSWMTKARSTLGKHMFASAITLEIWSRNMKTPPTRQAQMRHPRARTISRQSNQMKPIDTCSRMLKGFASPTPSRRTTAAGRRLSLDPDISHGCAQAKFGRPNRFER